MGDRRASAGCAHARVRSHVDTAQLLPSPGLFVLSFDEFQMGTATRTRFGRRHSVGNNSPPAQHRYDFLVEHATHFRPVDVVCQGSNVVWSLPFPPLVRELPVRLTTKIRQPPARIDLDPVATPPALDRLRPAGPVQSVVQPPLLIPGHGHSRNYSRNHGAVKLPCGVWPPAPAFRSAGGAPAEPLVPPIKFLADGVHRLCRPRLQMSSG